MSNDTYVSESKNKSKCSWSVVRSELCIQNNKKGNIILDINKEVILNPQEISDQFNYHFTNIVKSLNVLTAGCSLYQLQ